MPGSTYTFYNPNPDIPLAGDWDSDGDDTPAMLRVAAGSQVAHNRQYALPHPLSQLAHMCRYALADLLEGSPYHDPPSVPLSIAPEAARCPPVAISTFASERGSA